MGLFDIFTSKEERMRNLYADAIKLCDAGQYAKAAPMLLTVAEYGDPRAQKVYGELLEAGKGVARDPAAALAWYEKAAAQRYAEAAYACGRAYRRGLLGAQKDEGKARACYQVAADHSSPYGRFMYAYMLFCGEAGPVDYPQALQYFEKVTSQRDVPLKDTSTWFYIGMC